MLASFLPKTPVWVPKVTVGLYWTQKRTFSFYLIKKFLKCIHSKSSYLCSKGYSQLSCVTKGPSWISLKQKWFSHVFTPTAPFGFQWFLSTCFYYHSFSWPFLDLKRALKLYLDQNIILKCFDVETSHYGSKSYCWLGFYH